MYILHIETSTKVCSAAISRDELILAFEDRREEMNHAALLSPMIADLLSQCDLKSGDLGAVSVSSGPGSYTGLRVGSSTAKAIAYSLHIPLISVPTLESLATAAQEKGTHVLPMLDARRDEVYCSLFDPDMGMVWSDHAVLVNKPFIEEKLSGLGLVLGCGDGAFKLKPFLADFPFLTLKEEIICTARNQVPPAFARLSQLKTEDPLHFTPSYVKPPNITQPRKVG